MIDYLPISAIIINNQLSIINEQHQNLVENRRVKNFVRVFKYIWPQWPRIVVVVTSAIVVSILLSVSFMTVIPLLKVMTGQEGLRGWADRKICQWQYGVNFYVPESVDFTGNNSSDFSQSLLIRETGL
jgi:hypothetical protein